MLRGSAVGSFLRLALWKSPFRADYIRSELGLAKSILQKRFSCRQIDFGESILQKRFSCRRIDFAETGESILVNRFCRNGFRSSRVLARFCRIRRSINNPGICKVCYVEVNSLGKRAFEVK